jgi:outer membrane protein assembly factor BamB
VPTDLDEVFSALGRQADAVPLAPVAAAQQRGAQRRRRRAVLAGAAAVLVLIAGVGTVVWRGMHGPRPVPAAPALPSIRGMTPAGAPIEAPDKRIWTQTVTSDGRLYAAMETPTGDARMVAIDPRTATVLWQSATFHPFLDVSGPIAVPGALLVSDSTTVDEIPIFHVLDPGTGATRWKLPWRTHDEFVVGDDVLVRLVGSTGVTEAFDLRTGAPLWSLAAGGDRPAHIVGMQSDGYHDINNLIGPEITLSDDGLVQLTRGGQALMRDIRTGALLRSAQTGSPNPVGAVASDGQVFTEHRTTDKMLQIRVTGLTGTADKSRMLFTATEKQRAGRFVPCGPHRVCLSQSVDAQSKTMVVSIDTRTGKALWTAGLPTQVFGAISARGSRVLAGDMAETGLYDAKGRTVYAGPGNGQWIDDDNVLWTERADPGSMVSVVSARSGRKVKLGSTPGRTGNCTLTSDFLACPLGSHQPPRSELRIWRFTR